MVKIDSGMCTGCGLCVKDCIAQAIHIDANGKPVCGPGCIGCAHCVAICPLMAVFIPAYENDPALAFPQRLFNWFKFRRSVRAFQSRPVEQFHLDKILEVGRVAPSEANSQNVRYIVVTDAMGHFKDIAIKALYRQAIWAAEQGLTSGSAVRYGKFWINMYTKYMASPSAVESLTFGAPAAIMVVSPSEINGGLSAADMRLMSDAMGMGSFYSAFTREASLNPEVAAFLGLKDKEIVVTAIYLGYPDVTYARTAPHKALNVTYL